MMAPVREPLPTLDLVTLQLNLVATINGRFDALEWRFANLERIFFGDAEDGEAASDSKGSTPASPDTNGKRRKVQKSAEENDKRKKPSSSQD
jgi:hypothetical protein